MVVSPARCALIGIVVLASAAVAGSTRAASVSGPTNTAAPSVAGIAAVGKQLVALPGSWVGSGTLHYASQWYRCDAGGGHCSSVHGASASTYTLVAADTGKTVGLTVRVTDSTGTATAYASLVGPIAPRTSALVSAVRPSVTGTPAVGAALTVSAGTWTITPSSVSYAWQRCNANGRACTPIAGASTPTYAPNTTDVGHALVALVTATAGAQTQATLGRATSAVAGVAPAPAPTTSTRPTITGSARVHARLSAVPAPATGATFHYQWYRCDPTGAHCNSIHGATASSYTAVATDAAKTIGVTVGVTANGTATATYSSLVGPIAAAAATLAATAQPTVTGNPTVGQALTVSPGTWSAPTTSLAYAWQHCNTNGRICVAIPGANAASYSPTADDVGHELVAVVTAANGAATQPAFSLATAAIAAPPVLANTSRPTLSGTEKVGQRLTASPGTWAGSAPISYSYQWYRCDQSAAHCSSIHGATAPTYTLVAADATRTIGLTVTARDTGGSKAAYASVAGPIAPVAATLFATAQPALSETPIVGKALTVAGGSWSVTAASTTVQWERCNANGRICVPIAGATTTTYTVTAADVGHALIVLTSATAGSVTQAVLSTATAAATAS